MIRPSNRASIRNISDYSPFGVQLSERTISGDGYRFGFQGQEGDSEVKGEGNSVNYKYRMHDPRLGRFFAVDPISHKYPFYSPYSFSGNRVIDAVELEGKEPRITVTDKSTGCTFIKVYGYGNIESVLIVQTYEAKVHYINPDGSEEYLGSVNVTRDGWYSNGTDASGNSILRNRTTEPSDKNNISTEVGLEYSEKYGKGTPVYQLPDIFVQPFPEDFNEVIDNGVVVGHNSTRENNNVAKSVQFHVGGIYEGTDGKLHVGGTYGCFGIVSKEQVFSTEKEAKKHLGEANKINSTERTGSYIKTSNNAMQYFQKIIEKTRKGSEPIKVEIESRNIDLNNEEQIVEP